MYCSTDDYACIDIDTYYTTGLVQPPLHPDYYYTTTITERRINHHTHKSEANKPRSDVRPITRLQVRGKARSLPWRFYSRSGSDEPQAAHFEVHLVHCSHHHTTIYSDDTSSVHTISISISDSTRYTPNDTYYKPPRVFGTINERTW